MGPPHHRYSLADYDMTMPSLLETPHPPPPRLPLRAYVLIWNGMIKIVMTVYVIMILLFRMFPTRPTITIPTWMPIVFGFMFCVCWLIDGIEDVRRGIDGRRRRRKTDEFPVVTPITGEHTTPRPDDAR